jgi:endoglycosylceramidase
VGATVTRKLPLLLLGLAACRPQGVAPERFTVGGGHIRDGVGRALILRGLNVSQAHKGPPWFDFHGPEDFARMRADWGFNSVRLLISWAAIEPERGAYDAAYLDAVGERLDWARDAGLLVVLDMHQDLYGVGFAGGNGAPRWTCAEDRYAAFTPKTPWFLGYADPAVAACFDDFWKSRALQDDYAAMWAAVARRFKAHPAVLGFDVMNEPYWGTFPIDVHEASRLGPLYENVVARVRGEAEHWLAFLEPSSARNLGLPTQLPEFSFDRVVYAPHSYNADAEAGKGFDPAARAALLDNVQKFRAEAERWGAAVWIGEYGGNANHPGISEYMGAQYDAAGLIGAGQMYWEYGKNDGYGFLGPGGEEKPALAAAVVRPYPERIYGNDLSWSFDAATRTFHLSLNPVAGTSAPSELVVPTRVYPNGFQVECGGCRYETPAGRLKILGVTGGVTVTPLD